MTERTPFRARVHAPGAELDVQAYDFESPELIGGDDRARLDAALEAWGRQVGMLITAKTRAVVDVATAPSRIQSFGAFIASAEGPVLWATASSAGGRILYRIPLEEARYWAARMIGAAGDAAGDGAPLTSVERALARQVLTEQLAELQHATGGMFAEPVLEAFGTEPPSSVDRDAQAVVAVIGTLRRNDRRQLAAAIDAELVLQRLGAVAPHQDAAQVRTRIGGHLALAPVEIALRFDPTRVGPDTVLDLAAGDLIPLAHLADRPLVVTLDGEPVLHAAVGGNGERLACVVVSNGDLV
ncbi:FliM/FliN family flagellar motor switch protein [uncultured Amnibacterium sp.]|uniref:FliM/FliN family flagellar motor switch protein n=1 Tax=uncultured Amnibacterium sp. TaxID=1631851 RepID=UPI0035CC51CB